MKLYFEEPDQMDLHKEVLMGISSAFSQAVLNNFTPYLKPLRNFIMKMYNAVRET